jgi:CxxC-x17-CxxC domain-containing protein
MRKFNSSSSYSRDSKPSSGRRSGGTRFGGGSGRLDRNEVKPSRPAFGRSSNKDSGFELHEVTCDKCGMKCDIPFKPTNNKPVYCRSCFRKNEGLESIAGPDRFESRGRDREFKPRFEEFKSTNTTSNASPPSEDLDKINRKLDKIMKALKIE